MIHCHYGTNGRRAVFWRNLGALRGPIITTFHGFDANLLPNVYGVDMYRELFDEGDLFTVGSEFMRRRVLDLGAPPDRTIKLPLGVDLSRFKFRADREFRGEFRLLTVARLVEVKGIEYALRAAALIRAAVPRLRYTIAGDGPLRPMLEAMARSLSIDDIVTFKGAISREEADDVLAEASVFVLPGVVTAGGEQEGQSLAIAEAQACGIPVVATNVGGVPESVRHGETGMLVPPRDPQALGSAIVALARDAGTRQRMGREGRALVESRFNLEIQNDSLIEIYNSLQSEWEKRHRPTTSSTNGVPRTDNI